MTAQPYTLSHTRVQARPVPAGRSGTVVERLWLWFLTLAPFNYFYVAAFGWQVSWVESGGVSEGAPPAIKYAKDIAAVAVYAVFLCSVMIARRRRDGAVPALSLLVASLLVWEVATTLLSLTTIPPRAACTALWQNAGYIGFYFLTRYVVAADPQRIWDTLARRMVVVTAAVSVYGIYQRYFDEDRFRYWLPSGEVRARAVSTLGQPNNLAYFLLFAICILIASRRPRSLPGRLMLGTAVAWCLLLTISMSALGAVIIVVPLLLLLERRLKLLPLIAAASIAAVVGVIAIQVLSVETGAIATRIGSVLAGDDPSVQARLTYWSAVLHRTTWEWLIGTGPGTGGSITVSFFAAGDVDNNYLAVVLQFGVIGMLLLATICVLAIYESLETCLRSARSRENAVPVAAHVVRLGIVVSLLIVSTSANVLNMFPISMFFWVFLALPTVRPTPTAVRAAATPPRGMV